METCTTFFKSNVGTIFLYGTKNNLRGRVKTKKKKDFNGDFVEGVCFFTFSSVNGFGCHPHASKVSLNKYNVCETVRFLCVFQVMFNSQVMTRNVS